MTNSIAFNGNINLNFFLNKDLTQEIKIKFSSLLWESEAGRYIWSILYWIEELVEHRTGSTEY